MKLLLIALLGATLPQLALADDIEQPKYKVITSEDNFQLRNYDPYFVVQTTHKKTESSRSAFMRLFRYISGNNKLEQSIEMTAPVTSESVQIEMTAPVTSESNGSDMVMSFVIPSRFSEDQIPQPLDPLVSIAKVPQRTMAVITYSWYATERRKAAKAELLKQWIESQSNLKIVDGPIFAGYDAPSTLPNLRTNEVMFVVE